MKKLLIIILLAAAACASAKPRQTEQIRGVWIPDPSHTSLMHTYQHVLDGVASLDSVGVNMLYVCVQARDLVGFKSQVYTDASSFASPEEGYMFQPYMAGYNQPVASPTGDPLRDLITEAHKRDMKVVLWFEYGLMASHGPTAASHPLLAAHPEWQSRNSEGGQANYNNSDYSLNSYHEGLQQFMLDLIAESLRLYPDADGVQGDDRMPAAPRNSGYDEYTAARYRAETGSVPPADVNDPAWTAWRLSILNDLAKRIHRTVKGFGEEKLVCFSPNPYPWCEQMLMQDWPTWLREQLVDILSVQCYRFTFEHYKSTLDEVVGYVDQSGASRSVLNPGIILLASQYMPADTLKMQMDYNRQIGVNGEAFFWVDALKEPAIRQTIATIYNE